MRSLLLVAALLACTDNNAAGYTLKAHGFSDISLTGWSPMSCAEGDASSTGFVATNPRGERVEGVVCCGLVFKNCTVRF